MQDKYMKQVVGFYNESIRKIDGIITGAAQECTLAGRKVSIRVWSPVKKNELSAIFKQWWDDVEQTEMVFGAPQPFNYDEYDDTGVVTLDGAPFMGFYGRKG